MTDDETNERGGAGGDPRSNKSRCYSVLLFVVDLLLLCFLVPRSTRMTVRLAFLIAIRAILTVIGSVINLGLYQALQAHTGRTETTTLAQTVNTLFGLTKDDCSHREKRDTWANLLSRVENDGGEESMDEMELTKKDTWNVTEWIPNLENITNLDDKKDKVEMPNLDFDLLEENITLNEIGQNLNWNVSEAEEWKEDQITYLNLIFSIGLAVGLLVILVLSVALTCKLAVSYRNNQRKEAQLRDGFQALEEIYKLGQAGWEVNLN